jgi:Chromo (CHRromatin Organisation MOdifier) domain
LKPGGELQPLPIPRRPWWSMSVDFIFGLPKTAKGYDGICVFVDRLTKMVHFARCKERITGRGFAKLFIAKVFQYHGLPVEIICDRDARFQSRFWRETAQRMGTRVKMSTAFHPQTDGQTERLNRVLEEMLRHFICAEMNDCDTKLPLLEFAYNNAWNSSTQASPFRLYTGMHPLSPASNFAEKEFVVPTAGDFCQQLQGDLEAAKVCLQKARDRNVKHANKKRRKVEFSVGAQVLLSTVNLSLRVPGARKLWPRYIGPFTVEERVGKVAYRLQLPDSMKCHPVFHVSLLMPFKVSPGDSEGVDKFGRVYGPPPPVLVDGQFEYVVEAVLQHKTVGGGKRQFLVKWGGFGPEENSWEPEANLRDVEVFLRYLHLHNL